MKKSDIINCFISTCEIINQSKLVEYIDFCMEKSLDKHIKHQTERHHILPKSIFPEYENKSRNKWNITYLSYEDHYIAHSIIIEAIKDNGMLYAWNSFNSYKQQDIDLEIIGKEKYKELRELHSEIVSKQMSADNHWTRNLGDKENPNKGQKRSEEFCKMTSKRQIGELNHRYGVVTSNYTKELLSITSSGENNAMYGKKHDEQTLKLISDKTKEGMSKVDMKQIMKDYNESLEITTCEHCGKRGKPNTAMKRWHFDNCRKK